MSDYSFSKKTVSSLLKNMLNSKLHNKDIVTEIIFQSINSSSMEMLVYVMNLDEKYKAFYPRDTFKTMLSSYEMNTIKKDVLKDRGLLDSEGNVYGEVIKDGGWSSTADYNPYLGRVEVNIFTINDSGSLELLKKTVNTMSLEHVNKLDIPYFKQLNTLTDGLDILQSLEDRDEPF